MSLMGRLHKIQVSSTLADGSGAEHQGASGVGEEDTNIAFNLQSGHNTAAPEDVFYGPDDESGQESHLADSGATYTTVARGLTKSVTLAADDISLPFFMYYAGHGGAIADDGTGGAGTSQRLDTSGAYVGSAEGPSTGTIYSFTMADIGDSVMEDTDFNKIHPNVVVQRVALTGQSKGVLNINADLLSGGEEVTGWDTTNDDVAVSRSRLFNFGHVHLWKASQIDQVTPPNPLSVTSFDFSSGYTLPVSNLDTFASELLTNMSGLDTGVDVTAALRGFTLEFNQNVDQEASYSPGNTDSGGAGLVKWYDDWIYSNDAQQLTFEGTFVQNHSAGTNWVETLRDAYENKTEVALQLAVVHPSLAGSTPNSGMGFTIMFQAVPIEWEEVNQDFGLRLVRCKWKAVYDTVNDFAWSMAYGTGLSATLGYNS